MIKLTLKKKGMTRVIEIINNTYMVVIKGSPVVVDLNKLKDKLHIIEAKRNAGQPMGISDVEYDELLKIKELDGEDAIAEDFIKDYESMGWVLLKQEADK